MFRGNPARPATIRDHNRNLVLQLIEKNGQLSRAELAKLLRISEPTVSSIIENFLRKGLVLEAGTGESIGGRKPVILEFNPRVGYVVGVDAGGTMVTMGISDLAGSFILKESFPIEEVGFGEAAVPGLARLINTMIEASHLPSEQVLGVGVAVPGVTDPESGMVYLAPAFHWNNLPLRKLLEEKLGSPVAIENDVNAAALAEKQWGAARDFQDFVFVNVGTGIGAGLILNGELHRGFRHAAGEVGYMIVDMGWMQHQESQADLTFGYLESKAAVPGVVRRVAELGGLKSLPTGSAAAESGSKRSLSMEEIVNAANNGDAVALQAISEVADYLAAGIINLVLAVSPQAVVLGGGVARAGGLLVEPLRARIAAFCPVKPQILLSSMQADTGLIGAASLAAQKAKLSLIKD